jgi:hypothetical protein
MSNTRQIQPVQIWTATGQKEASILALTNFFDYHFDDGNGKVNYKLIGMEGEPASAFEYITANIEIPASIIQQWGADDSIIWNYIAEQLNLTLI